MRCILLILDIPVNSVAGVSFNSPIETLFLDVGLRGERERETMCVRSMHLQSYDSAGGWAGVIVLCVGTCTCVREREKER